MDPTSDLSLPEAAARVPAAQYHLDPGLPRRWSIVALLVVALPAIGGAVVAAIFGLLLLLPAIAAIAALLPWLLYRYGRRYVATFRCVLDDAGLFVERGVWWRSQTSVPRQRVQHTDVDQGPLARRFGLATLKVFTAGSAHGQIDIEDLRHDDAVQLRDELLQRHEPASS